MSALVALSLSSCSESFLDHPADNRTEIDSEDKIVKLLTSSYPSANFMWVSEMSSDNFIDNRTPHLPTKTWNPQILSYYNYSPYDRADDQLWLFEPATQATFSDYDQPGQIWDGYYASIASANAALQAIDEVSAKNGGMTPTLRAARAEALLIRAYSHFCLVNVFCQPYKDDEASKRDIGIPYVTEVEDVVQKMLEFSKGTRFVVMAPIHLHEGRTIEQQLKTYQLEGYARIYVKGDFQRIDEYLEAGKYDDSEIYLVIDRLSVDDTKDVIARLVDSAETAFYEGHGELRLLF